MSTLWPVVSALSLQLVRLSSPGGTSGYGSSVDLVMDFTDPIIRGMSLFHCHLLNHEDKGMMAKILFR